MVVFNQIALEGAFRSLIYWVLLDGLLELAMCMQLQH